MVDAVKIRRLETTALVRPYSGGFNAQLSWALLPKNPFGILAHRVNRFVSRQSLHGRHSEEEKATSRNRNSLDFCIRRLVGDKSPAQCSPFLCRNIGNAP